MNALHATGIGLDGTTTGLGFLQPGTGAAGMAVNPVIAADPLAIGASQSGAPGDGAIALDLSEIRYDTALVAGQYSIEEGYAELVSRIGGDVRRAEDLADVRQTLRDSLQAQRDEVSGVSLDEEAVNIMRFQAGFQAAAKVASTINEMLDEILALLD